MIKDAVDVENPYWQQVQQFPGDQFLPVYSPDWTCLETMKGQLPSREDLCRQYAWSIPDPASLAFVAQHLQPKAVEIGAGVGYWAHLLAEMGVDIVCYDLFPPHLTGKNHYHSPRTKDQNGLLGVTREVFYPVHAGNHLMAANYPDWTLFLCWPPYDESVASDCLDAYTGQKLVYIGEGEEGCTADDRFFEMLSEGWEMIESHKPVQWSGIHDFIEVYERK